jgi:hypothetical protein
MCNFNSLEIILMKLELFNSNHPDLDFYFIHVIMTLCIMYFFFFFFFALIHLSEFTLINKNKNNFKVEILFIIFSLN